jgi:hypothetical protein
MFLIAMFSSFLANGAAALILDLVRLGKKPKIVPLGPC